MSNFDDLFDAQPRQEQEDHPFDKEAWAEKKQAERQEVYELADATTLEVSEDGEKFKAFLDVKSRLIHYSATNALPRSSGTSRDGKPKARPSSATRATSRSWRRATTMSVPMAASAPHGM